MGIVAVHAAIGQQAHQVQGAAVLLTVLHGLQQGGVLEKGAVLNLLRNPGQLLVNDAPGSHVQMAHLGIAHLAFRQPYCHPAGIAPHKRAILHEPVHDRGPGQRHRVAVFSFVQSVSV